MCIRDSLYLVQYLLLLGADMVEVVAGSDIHERGGFSGFYIVHEQLYVCLLYTSRCV